MDVDDHPEQEEQHTCSHAGLRQRVLRVDSAVQQAVGLQEAVQSAEHRCEEDDLQRDRLTSSPEGVDTTPVEVVQHEGTDQQGASGSPPGSPPLLPGQQQHHQRQQQSRSLLQEPGQSGGAATALRGSVPAVGCVGPGLTEQVDRASEDQSPAERGHGRLTTLHLRLQELHLPQRDWGWGNTAAFERVELNLLDSPTGRLVQVFNVQYNVLVKVLKVNDCAVHVQQKCNNIVQ